MVEYPLFAYEPEELYVSPIHIINGEIQAVLAIMRQDGKYALGPRLPAQSSRNDNGLINSLKLLRETLAVATEVDSVGALTYLKPFLDVIKSDQTNGPITLVALSSVHKFLSYQIIKESTPKAADAIAAVCEAVTHCRFEGRPDGSGGDDVVLLKILQTLLECIKSPVGHLLSDELVCECVLSCFRISRLQRFSELLRRAAEYTLVDMMRTIFGRLHELVEARERVDAEARERGDDDDDSDSDSSTSESLPDHHFRILLEHSGSASSIIKDAAAVQQQQPPPPAVPPTQLSNPSLASPTSPTDPTSPPPQPTPASSPLVSSSSSPVPSQVPTLPKSATTQRLSSQSSQAPGSPRALPTTGSGGRSETIISTQPQQPVRLLRMDDQKHIRIPYGLPCMEEILRFLITLVNPTELNSTEELRMLGFNLINIALEKGGGEVAKLTGVVGLLKDDLCKYLLQNARTENLSLLSLTLRVIFNLFQAVRPIIKLQAEVFFNHVYLRLMDQRWMTYEGQEMVLESLVDFCREKTIMSDLYGNYDCDLQRTNVFENICKFLCKNAFPVSGQPSAIHTLCLDGILAIISNICNRCVPNALSVPSPAENQGSGSWDETFSRARQRNGLRLQELPAIKPSDASPPADIDPEAEEAAEKLRTQKQMKKRLIIGADHFNRDPKKGIDFLQGTFYTEYNKGLHVLPDPLEPLAVAQFLRNTPGLNKNLIGDYMGENNPFNIAVLKAFVSTFDFKGEALDSALRMFLESFRIPGEAQKIDRIVQAYAEQYFVQNNPCVFTSADTAYTLAFSTIMLNTDQHNKGIKKKMTMEEFIKNNRGIDNNKDLPREMLENLYRSISTNEIKMMTDDSTGVGEPGVTAVRWTELMKRSVSAGAFVPSPYKAPSLHKDMFSAIWGPTIAAASAVFDMSEEDQTLPIQKSLDGFARVAIIAAHYGLGDVLDNLIITLCKFTNILQPALETVAISFGRSAKSQMAAMSLFNIARTYGSCICEGWRNVLDVILRIHKLGLIPASMLAADDFTSDPDSTRRPSLPRSSLGGGGGGGAQGAYWQYMNSDSALHDDATPQEKEAEMAMRECLALCQIEDVLTGSKNLRAESLSYLAKSLVLASFRSKTSSIPIAPPSTAPLTPAEEDVAVLCLELLVQLALQNRDRIALLWPYVHDQVDIILGGPNYGAVLLQRAVVGILRVCMHMLHEVEVSEDLLKSLDLLTRLDPQVADAFADRIAIGVLNIVQANAPFIRSTSAWQTIFTIVKSHARHSIASAHGLDTLSFFIKDCAYLTPSNLRPCVTAIVAYAESPCGGHTRSMHALDLLHTLHQKLAGSKDTLASFTTGDQGWLEFWLVILKAFRQVCKDARSDVRNYAVILLQRSLLAADVREQAPHSWNMCFNEVLFPLFSDLLQYYDPKSGLSRPQGIDKTLQRALALLSKIFLQHLVRLSTLVDFHLLWVQVLQFMERYVSVAGNESLTDAVPEVLKNIVLVMMTSGLLRAPPCNSNQQKLWDATWPALATWYPSLKAELFPDA